MITVWLTPRPVESTFSPERIARIQHHRYMLADAWAMQLKTDPDTPQGKQLSKLCGRLIFDLSQTSPELAI